MKSRVTIAANAAQLSGISPSLKPLAYDLKGLLALVPVSRSMIFTEINAGRLKRVKLAGRALFDPRDVEAWWSSYRDAQGGAA